MLQDAPRPTSIVMQRVRGQAPGRRIDFPKTNGLYDAVKGKYWIPCAFAVLLASVGKAFLDTHHHETAKPDYEEQWDYLADSGNQVPHGSHDRALLAHRTVVLTRDVNANAAHHVIGSLLLLEKAAPGKPIELWIRTNGGWSEDAFAIIDVMETISSPVTTIAMGSTSSAGAMILAAGTGGRKALPNAVVMVHDNLSEDKGEYSLGRAERATELAFWKRTAKLPSDWFTQKGDFSYFLNAEQAMEFGLVDEIVPRVERAVSSR